MIIENVAASFPTRKVGNEEVVDLIRFHSRNFAGDLAGTTRAIHDFLDGSGLVTRHWQAANERPIEHLDHAVSSAMKGSGLLPADVDLLIYVGVGGGFREPGNSYMVAKSLGMVRAECFDVIDASMSWTRAVSLVDSLFKTDQYRNALVVNAEFNMTAGGPIFPANFALQNFEQLEYVLPSYTIGEAATATLLLPDKPENFRIAFHARPDLADLCLVPGIGFKDYGQSPEIGALGLDRLTARSSLLHLELEPALSHLLRGSDCADEEATIVLTHTSSSKEWHEVARKLGFAEKVYDIYPHTGNIVSASIPGALVRARENGRLDEGQRVLFFMGSAGMSVAAGTFEHQPRSHS